MLYIHDTAKRDKRTFTPIRENEVSLYVCGLTVYDLPHIGHARTFVVFDVVRRILEHAGYKVTLVRNHTDIDDKIIRRAKEEGTTPELLAQRMIDGLNGDMSALGVQRADIEPRVTQHIPHIIEFIDTLVQKSLAYPTPSGDVYFRVKNYPAYGELSNRNTEDMLAGVRVEVSEEKEAPGDFALWKGAKSEEEPGWDSPWGRGRPGWHIECSVMSTHYLGKSFDIHGGGRDLIFPHHENEIAQSKGCLGGDFANYWMHVGMVEIDGEKMSHSLGNFWTVRDILKQVHREALRFFFLTTHYRNNINFSHDTIYEATQRVTALVRTLLAIDEATKKYAEKNAAPVGLLPAFAEYREALHDDFNTPKALAVLASVVRRANELADTKGKADEKMRELLQCRKTIIAMCEEVGLLTDDISEISRELRDYAVKRLNLNVEEIERALALRGEARRAKDWVKSDEIRDRLLALGVRILDKVDGTAWQVD